jgi:hypothetical protein
MDLDNGLNNFPGFDSKAWESDPEIIAGFQIVSYGKNNNLPVEIRDLMDENNLAPGILEREKGLLYGQGIEYIGSGMIMDQVVRDWGTDKEIWEWLKRGIIVVTLRWL